MAITASDGSIGQHAITVVQVWLSVGMAMGPSCIRRTVAKTNVVV